MSKPSSSSVLTSGSTPGLPGVFARIAEAPPGPGTTEYTLNWESDDGCRPALPHAPRRRSELTASKLQKLSSDTTHVADTFGYFCAGALVPNVELSSKRIAP